MLWLKNAILSKREITKNGSLKKNITFNDDLEEEEEDDVQT